MENWILHLERSSSVTGLNLGGGSFSALKCCWVCFSKIGLVSHMISHDRKESLVDFILVLSQQLTGNSLASHICHRACKDEVVLRSHLCTHGCFLAELRKRPFLIKYLLSLYVYIYIQCFYSLASFINTWISNTHPINGRRPFITGWPVQPRANWLNILNKCVILQRWNSSRYARKAFTNQCWKGWPCH